MTASSRRAVGVLDLRFGGGDRAGGACLRGAEGRQAFLQVHRVHLGQQLARLDGVAHVHQHAQHAPGGGRADQPGAPRLHGAGAEQAWRQ
jgi:hypothetical protein